MYDDILSQVVNLNNERRSPNDLVRRRLYGDNVILYVRIGLRACGHKLLVALVIADCEVAGTMRRQGVYSGLLAALEVQAPTLGIQVLVHENVGNPHLLQYLVRQGYRPTMPSFPDTVYKEIP